MSKIDVKFQTADTWQSPGKSKDKRIKTNNENKKFHNTSYNSPKKESLIAPPTKIESGERLVQKSIDSDEMANQR